jgi:hypothetical protein
MNMKGRLFQVVFILAAIVAAFLASVSWRGSAPSASAGGTGASRAAVAPLSLPFAARFVAFAPDSQAEMDLVALSEGSRPIAARDSDLLGRQAGFLGDFLAWYPPGKRSTDEDLQRLIPRTSPDQWPDPGELRNMARTVVAVLAADDQRGDRGRHDALVEALMAYLRDVDRNFGCPRGLVTHLVRTSSEVTLYRHLAGDLMRGGRSAGQLAALSRQLLEYRKTIGTLGQAVRNDWQLVRRQLGTPEDLGMAEVPAGVTEVYVFFRKRFDFTYGVAAAIAERSSPLAERLPLLNLVFNWYGTGAPLTGLPSWALAGDERTGPLSLPPEPPPLAGNIEQEIFKMFADIRVSNVALAAQKDADGENQHRGLLVLIEVLRYRQEKGTVPADLGAVEAWLGHKLPVDALGTRPFNYQRTGELFTLTMPGPPVRDEHGRAPLHTIGAPPAAPRSPAPASPRD